MKKINEFSISAFVATVPEVKEFEKSSIARFCLSVSHTENKVMRRSPRLHCSLLRSGCQTARRMSWTTWRVSTSPATDSSSPTHGKRMARSAAVSSSLSLTWKSRLWKITRRQSNKSFQAVLSGYTGNFSFQVLPSIFRLWHSTSSRMTTRNIWLFSVKNVLLGLKSQSAQRPLILAMRQIPCYGR